MQITETQVLKLIDTIDHGLVKGLGIQEPGKMCVEAAVCYALGLPHSDDPGCVDAELRRLKIYLNDANWSSNAARAAGMKKLAILQLGTKDVLDGEVFRKKLREMTIRKVLPLALRAAGMEAEAVRCEKEGSIEAAKAAKWADYAADAAKAAKAAKWADYAADAASWAGYAVYENVYETANAAYYASKATQNDIPLEVFADGVCDILIDMQVPAVKFLGLL